MYKLNWIRNADIKVDASIFCMCLYGRQYEGTDVDRQKESILGRDQFQSMGCRLLLKSRLWSKCGMTIMFVILQISDLKGVPAVQGVKLS